MEYLRRARTDIQIPGIENWYYVQGGMVYVSEIDDVKLPVGRPFRCPDCNGYGICKVTWLGEIPWFDDKYQCRICRSVFISDGPREQWTLPA